MSLTPKDIANGWGNRAALEAEEAIKKIDEEIAKNNILLESGELEFEKWEELQAELRSRIPECQKIIRTEVSRYSEFLKEREKLAA